MGGKSRLEYLIVIDVSLPESIQAITSTEKKGQWKKRPFGTKPGTLLKHHPVKTKSWDVKVPGFTNIEGWVTSLMPPSKSIRLFSTVR